MGEPVRHLLSLMSIPSILSSTVCSALFKSNTILRLTWWTTHLLVRPLTCTNVTLFCRQGGMIRGTIKNLLFVYAAGLSSHLLITQCIKSVISNHFDWFPQQWRYMSWVLLQLMRYTGARSLWMWSSRPITVHGNVLTMWQVAQVYWKVWTNLSFLLFGFRNSF